MKTAISYLVNFALLALLFWSVATCRGYKADYNDLSDDYKKDTTYYSAKYDSCIKAKSTSDTTADTTEHFIEYKEIPVPKDLTFQDSLEIYNIMSETSLNGEPVIAEWNRYEDTVSLRNDSLQFTYEALVHGNIHWIKFPWYRVISPRIVEKTVVQLPPKPQDPVIEYKYRRGWYVGAYIGSNTDKILSPKTFGGDVGYMTKKGVSFGTGLQYVSLPDDDGLFIKLETRYYFGK